MSNVNWQSYSLPAGTVAVAAGAVMIVGTLTFNLTHDLTKISLGAYSVTALGAGIGLFLLGAILGAIGVSQLEEADAFTEKDARNRVMYYRYLVGVGYTLLLLAVLNLEALAGIAGSGALPVVFPNAPDQAFIGVRPPAVGRNEAGEQNNNAGESKHGDQNKNVDPNARTPVPVSPTASAVVLLFTLSMSILGALFFIANSLRDSRENEEDFEQAIFWGGLWYRLGEAVLFAIVAFLIFSRFSTDPGSSIFSMPVIALFMSMFIRTGEQVIFGLSKRFLLGAKALIPLEISDEPLPPGPAPIPKPETGTTIAATAASPPANPQ